MAQDRNLILTVCTGNVCRSPMAQKLLQHALAAEGAPYDKLVVESAGVAAGYGEPASANSVAALKKVKIDLTQHKSQPITQTLLDRAFLILGMTDSHLDILTHYHKGLSERMHLFREFMEPHENEQIPDPYGQNFDAYQACLDSMIEAIPSLVRFIKQEYK
jgi:protein-tyrosine phosphatase